MTLGYLLIERIFPPLLRRSAPGQRALCHKGQDPDSNCTYRDVIRLAERYGGSVHCHTINKWVRNGNTDIRANKNATAYARFAKWYLKVVNEHCGPEINRSRELNKALELLN